MSTENCENYVIINGQKYILFDDETKKRLSFLKSVSPFEIVNGEIYYYIRPDGTISSAQYVEDATDESLSAVANCCRNIELLQQRAYWETLNRLLWRYSVEHDGDKIDWERDKCKYCIYYDHACVEWRIGKSYTCYHFQSYFYSEKIAKDAIEEIILPFIEIYPNFNPMAVYNGNH